MAGAVVSIGSSFDAKGIDKAQKELDKLKTQTSGASSALQESSGRMSALGKTAAIAAVAGVAVAAKATYDFAAASVSAAQEAQVADARLGAVAKSMGYVSGAYRGGIDRMNEYSTQLSKQIGVEDESIKAVQSKLLTFKAVGDTMNDTGGAMDRATQAAYDLASAGFGSAEGNATQLGKALQDPIKGISALTRSGVTFTAAEKDKIKALVESGNASKAQEMILKAVEKQVGGTAAATATAADKMKVSFGELQEKVGAALLPTLNKIADTLGPIFEKLQGPLGKVAEMLGGAIAKAFDALAPVLPVLAEALGKIAGVLGTVLTAAISALVPVITPLLSILGQLATRIGPILEPILMKIGTVLGELLSAVMPLLAPLTQLVMGILDAAAPILGVAVDLVGILVRALGPLFAAVGQLLQPLGQLIMVLLKAILPVIEPLLPVIEALAKVLGDVLTRAVGVIMTAIGFLIQAFAKLAPFVLENVTKPVVSIFLEMVSKIVEGAATAFGWVPGLGDKLKGAADAIKGFRDSATKAVSEAAKTIGTEGGKIGKDLVDNGVKMMTDPASVQAVQTAGYSVGKNMADGVAQGLVNTSSLAGIAAASRKTVKTAETAARNEAQTKSPSKKFAKIGKDLTDGLVQGIQNGERSAVVAMRKLLSNVLSQSNNVGSMGKKALSAFIENATNVKDVAQSRLDQLRSYFERMRDITRTAFDNLKSIAQTRVDDMTSKLDDLKNSAKDFGQSIRDAFKVAFGTPDEGGSILGKFGSDVKQARGFLEQIKQLRGMGLNSESLQNILSAGAENGTKIAEELLKGGAPAVNQVNELVSMLNSEAGVLADTMANAQYGQQIADATAALAQAQAAYDAIAAEEQRQLAALEEMATAFGLQVDPMQTALDNAQANIENLLSNQETSTDLLATSVSGVTSGLLSTAAQMAKEARKLGKRLDELDAGIAAAQSRLDTLNAVKGGRAMGGPVTSGTWLVGEAGPELITVGQSGYVTPNGAIGGNSYSITVNAGVGDPRQIGQTIVQYVKQFEAANGPVFAAA